jgi:hypothetical protein
MSRRKRTILLAALALAAPVSAFGVGEVSSEPEPTVADLGVTASLDSCGVLQTQIVCQISVSYETLANATSYTASVTSPDGAVTDYGEVPAGGTSLTVPYAGNGHYGVRITAYGEPEEPAAEPEVIDTDVAENVGAAPAKPRVTKETVKPQVTTRHAPSVEQDAGDDVEAAPEPAPDPTCAEQPAEPAAPADPQSQATPDASDPAAAEAQAGATSDETSADTRDTEPAPVEAQAAETAPAEPAPAPAPADCTAP